MPGEKESPGLAVDVEVGVTPESSVADGSVHVTATAAPSSVVWTVMSPGQSAMTGAVLSMVAVANNRSHTIHTECKCLIQDKDSFPPFHIAKLLT